MGFFRNIITTVKEIYSKPRYVILNVASLLIYYYVFTFLISYQNYGILLIETPSYLAYTIILLSSILFTVSIYSIKNTKKNQAKISGSSVSIMTLLLSGVVGGCGCTAPLIYGLGVLGLGVSATSTLAYTINSYIIPLFYILILVNLVIILYYLNKLSLTSCTVKKNRKINKKKNQ